MESQIINMITENGIETCVLAVIINILTGLVKMPIKTLCKKSKCGGIIARTIVFLPIILGFGITVGYRLLFNMTPIIDKMFYHLWLSSSSLSLTIYAILEKMFPSKKKIMQECELEANRNLMALLQEILQKESRDEIDESTMREDIIPKSNDVQTENLSELSEKKKIVLYGEKNET